MRRSLLVLSVSLLAVSFFGTRGLVARGGEEVERGRQGPAQVHGNVNHSQYHPTTAQTVRATNRVDENRENNANAVNAAPAVVVPSDVQIDSTDNPQPPQPQNLLVRGGGRGGVERGGGEEFNRGAEEHRDFQNRGYEQRRAPENYNQVRRAPENYDGLRRAPAEIPDGHWRNGVWTNEGVYEPVLVDPFYDNSDDTNTQNPAPENNYYYYYPNQQQPQQ